MLCCLWKDRTYSASSGKRKRRMKLEKVNKLYVGNLNFGTTEDELKNHFEQNGIQAKSVTIIKDKYTDRSKGFGFVEVDSQETMQQAIEALNGKEFNGRTLTVNEARPPRERSGGSDFGGRRRSKF